MIVVPNLVLADTAIYLELDPIGKKSFPRFAKKEKGVVLSLHIARRVTYLVRKSGLLFTSLYLKRCAVCLQQYYAESSISDKSQSDVQISLSRAGIPRIIPAHHRHIIMRRGERGDYLVKLYLSFFSLCRVIPLAKKIDRRTFASIEDEEDMGGSVQRVGRMIEGYSQTLYPRYMPWLSKIPMLKGISWVPTWKSIPNSDKRVRNRDVPPNIFSCLKYEIVTFSRSCQFFAFGWEEAHPVRLWLKATIWPYDFSYTEQMLQKSYDEWIDYCLTCWEEWFWTQDVPVLKLSPGRLAASYPGAGKRRLFAIGNYIRQRLLRPVHDWGMKVLSLLPCDGTYNQVRPIHRLRAKRPENCCSFDLTSATDRWPATIYYSVLKPIWGHMAAECIVRGTLSSPLFKIGPPLVKRERICQFDTGTPLGYYGSWALFSLSHHVMVWLAAQMAYPKMRHPFDRYALLGDDIVIADRNVAEEYRRLLGLLGVSISQSKSLDSSTGALEFAKQFWVKKVQVNLTPISAKAMMSCHTFLGLCYVAEKYELSHSCLCRLAGMGFRVRARIKSNKLSLRWRRLKVIADRVRDRGSLPLDWWIGRGKPLNPYLKGIIVAFVRERVKPVELGIIPDKYVRFNETVFFEYTLYQNWIKDWLKWVRWYCLLEINADPSLEELLNPPICTTTWQRRNDKKDLIKFGLLWKCWDMGDGWSLQTVPPCLTQGRKRTGETINISDIGSQEDFHTSLVRGPFNSYLSKLPE